MWLSQSKKKNKYMKSSKRKNQAIVFNIFSMILSVAIIPLALISYAVWLKVIICLVVCVLNGLCAYVSYANYIKYQKFLEEELKKADEKRKKKMSLLDTYGILGISPQYNSDGSMKDIFDLLKIKPEYDANGNRVLTIYERLGINPLFTPLGLEIPYVFRVKNRIRALVRAAEGSIPLFYVPRRSHMRGVDPHIPVVGPATPETPTKPVPKGPAPIIINKDKKGPAKKPVGFKAPPLVKHNHKMPSYGKNTAKIDFGATSSKKPSDKDATDLNKIKNDGGSNSNNDRDFVNFSGNVNHISKVAPEKTSTPVKEYPHAEMGFGQARETQGTNKKVILNSLKDREADNSGVQIGNTVTETSQPKQPGIE